MTASLLTRCTSGLSVARTVPCTRNASARSEVQGVACHGGTVFEGFSKVVGEVPVRGRSLAGMLKYWRREEINADDFNSDGFSGKLCYLFPR